jgi:hypothetical protein
MPPEPEQSTARNTRFCVKPVENGPQPAGSPRAARARSVITGKSSPGPAENVMERELLRRVIVQGLQLGQRALAILPPPQ